MDSPDQFLAQRVVNGAVPRNTSHSIKRVRRDLNPEMTLPPFLISRMAAVLFALVHNFQCGWIEDIAQSCLNFLNYQHFSASTPFMSMRNS